MTSAITLRRIMTINLTSFSRPLPRFESCHQRNKKRQGFRHHRSLLSVRGFPSLREFWRNPQPPYTFLRSVSSGELGEFVGKCYVPPDLSIPVLHWLILKTEIMKKIIMFSETQNFGLIEHQRQLYKREKYIF